MRLRVGHARPIGTTTRMRLYNATTEPQIGAYVYDAPVELKRGYLIVGVEEVARPGRWNLLLERVSWDELLEHVDDVAFEMVRRP